MIIDMYAKLCQIYGHIDDCRDNSVREMINANLRDMRICSVDEWKEMAKNQLMSADNIFLEEDNKEQKYTAAILKLTDSVVNDKDYKNPQILYSQNNPTDVENAYLVGLAKKDNISEIQIIPIGVSGSKTMVISNGDVRVQTCISESGIIEETTKSIKFYDSTAVAYLKEQKNSLPSVEPISMLSKDLIPDKKIEVGATVNYFENGSLMATQRFDVRENMDGRLSEYSILQQAIVQNNFYEKKSNKQM